MKQECLEMNKMEPATNINLPPTRHCHNQCVFFYIPVFYYHFSSHSWYAWSCLTRSSQRWSKSKSSPARDCTTAARAKTRSALRKGRVRCGRAGGWRDGCWRATANVQLATETHGVFSAARLQTGPQARCFQRRTGPAWPPKNCRFLDLSFLIPVGSFHTLTRETVVYCILQLASHQLVGKASSVKRQAAKGHEHEEDIFGDDLK